MTYQEERGISKDMKYRAAKRKAATATVMYQTKDVISAALTA